MKKQSLKRPRRKIVPICYKKRSLSNSNTSLSQLLSIGSYKKRINELARNNRCLAVALQDARCETAYQSSIIRDYANGHNQIMFARLKLQGMAQTITQLVSDLDEVVNCLDINWASEHNLLQRNGPPHDKMKIKAPTVDSIEEESTLSSENGDCEGSTVSRPNSTSNEEPSDKASNIREGVNEIQPSTSEIGTNDLPPILFVEESADNPVEKLSRGYRSSRKTVVIQASLTPELDVDLCVLRKRSSSRRQSQQFVPSAPSSNRSNRKSSYHRVLSLENATPKRASESSVRRELSSALMSDEEYHENKNSDSASGNVAECEKIISGENEFPDSTSVNMKDRGSRNTNSSSPNLQYEHTVNHDVNSNNSSNVPSVHLSNNNTVPNLTILTCEDMELTEVINPLQQIVSENPPTTVGCPVSHSDRKLISPRVKEGMNNVEKTYTESELFNAAENSDEIQQSMHLNDVKEKSCESTINDIKVCNNSENIQPNESHNKKHSASPCRRTSRNTNKVMYKLFLSSSESESDSTPIKPESNNKKGKNIHRDTVIFRPKSCKEILDKKDKHESHSKSSIDLDNPLSVYDLDVSNSKRPSKKVRQKSKTKKSSHDKKNSKPVSQNCNVTKLQGVTYKFTKTENLVNKVHEHELLQNCSFLPETNPTICTDETIKKKQSSCTSNYAELGTVAESKETANPIDDELSPGKTCFKNQELSTRSPKFESKRVSFAPTDLVCNFNKKAVSKKIADDKKVLYTSKYEIEECVRRSSLETKDSPQFKTSKSSHGIVETSQSPDDLFNFSDETELYTFMLPCNTHQATIKADKLPLTKTTASLLTPICESYADQNSKPSKSTTKQKLGKLSLKGNKNRENKPQHNTFDKIDVISEVDHSGNKNHESKLQSNISYKIDVLSEVHHSGNENHENKPQRNTSDKIDTDVLSEVHHSLASVAPSTYKNSQKDSSHDNLKGSNSQTLELPQAEKQIKCKISKQFHSTPVEDMPIPIDEIKCVTKSRKRKTSSLKQELLPETTDKTKKSSTRRKLVETSPVLRDLLNLEEEVTRDSSRRRAKVVSYKEPSLNKKMRRG